MASSADALAGGLARRLPALRSRGCATVLREHPTSRERVDRDRDAGRGRRPHAGDRPAGRGRRLRRARAPPRRRARASRAVSEERGVVDFGDDGVLVVIDPIDGSLNAKRGLTHHALSIAVADGPTMADVAFGYVLDFGPGEEWRAQRGGGRVPRRRAGSTRRPSAAPPTAGSSWSRSSRPTRAGSRAVVRRARATSPAACARSARSRSRSARSRRRASTGWPPCGCRARRLPPRRS